MADEGGNHCHINRPGVITFGKRQPTDASLSLLTTTECVAHLSSGGEHSALVCMSGRVYTLGWIEYHDWMRREIALQPMLVSALTSHKIIQAACGSRSTYFLTDTGVLYSCGRNNFGQLGTEDTGNHLTPVLVEGLPCIKMVAAGSNHAVVLTDSGDVWSCGHNNYGQLGLGHINSQTSFARVPDLDEPITDVSCGAFHTALLTASGRLLTSGLNDCHQLGLSGMQHSSSFVQVPLPSTVITSAVCGYSHTVAVAADGLVWAWGLNDGGQLGNGKSCERCAPTRMVGLEAVTVSRVFAGFAHTALVTHEGEVLLCGRGRSGEMGPTRANISLPMLLQKLPELVVEQVTFGSEYSVFLVMLGPKKSLRQQALETSNGDIAKFPITDLEKAIIRSLQCPKCSRVMCAPIHLCVRGHSLCASCYLHLGTKECPACGEPFIPGQNIALQSLTAHVSLPCLGCFLRMPVSCLEEHAKACPRQW